jgi:hypothetical protein
MMQNIEESDSDAGKLGHAGWPGELTNLKPRSLAGQVRSGQVYWYSAEVYYITGGKSQRARFVEAD